jgi:hypothetical protein
MNTLLETSRWNFGGFKSLKAAISISDGEDDDVTQVIDERLRTFAKPICSI